MSDFTYLTDVWLISCVVNANTDVNEKILLAARSAGAKFAMGHGARGFGARERLGALAVAVETEKFVISVLVSTEQRDIVFEAMYKAGGLDRAGAGMIYVTPIEKLATYVPASIIRELSETASRSESA